tara:strand:- start:380 stop:484 length:105 start_codon:yes stop_codon:yes gene_type:complete
VSRRRLLAGLAVLLLAGCGKKGKLEQPKKKQAGD